MKTNIISVKQLRQDFEGVRRGIRLGHSYVLVYRSHPIAELRPLPNSAESHEDRRAKIQRKIAQIRRLAGGLKLSKSLTPEKINRLYEKSYESVLLGR